MSNDNETVEQVCEVLNQYPKAEASDGSGLVVLNNSVIAKRILAAHKRELAAVRAERDEWQRQALEENAALDVARAELAAKDKFIKELTEVLESPEEYYSKKYEEVIAKAREAMK